MRKITIDCESCGKRIPIEQGKEALIAEGQNSYHLIDLCATCLDDRLKSADSVNDTEGFRQQKAVLLSQHHGRQSATD